MKTNTVLNYTNRNEDGGSMILRNVGILPQRYTMSGPRKPRLESSSPWKPQTSHLVWGFHGGDISSSSKLWRCVVLW
jgi:hypothetical protein